ncbi:MAG: helix-turn-helix domain-containing protein [Syntrophobacteria bacterium]
MAKRSKYDELKPFNRHDKNKVHTGWWADMPKAAKRVYLLVHRYADQYGASYPKVETMAKEAGVDAKTISRGIKDLAEYTQEFEFWVEYKGPKKQKYQYRIEQLPRDHPNTIRMYPELIDEGHFKKLSFSAMSVYFAMRGLVSKVEKEANWVKVKGEGIETYKVPYAEAEATNTKIAQAAGVDRRNMKEILRELTHALLIKPVEWDQEKMRPKGKKWVVYVLPVYSLALKDEEHGTYEVENAEALDEICRILSQEKSYSVPEMSEFVGERSQTSSLVSSLKPEKEEDSNSFHSLKSSSYKMGLQEEKSIRDKESSPGEPGALTSRSDAPVRSPETPVREEPCFECSLAKPDGLGGMECTVPGILSKHDCYEIWKKLKKDATSSEQIKERIITDWNKRDCKQCRYRDNDEDTEYCVMASGGQENTIGEMEYCPKDE